VNDEREHDLNALAAHLEGRLYGEERKRTVDHLSACRDCRETAALLSRSWDVAGGREERRSAGRILAGRAHPWWVGLAAAALVGTAVAVRLLPTTSPVLPPPIRPSSSPEREPASAAKPSGLAVPSSAQTMPRPAPSAQATGSALDESLLARRGGMRHVGGKAFRLEQGEWVDVTFEPAAGLPVIDVAGPDERREIGARIPALAPYIALSDRFVIVFEGTVFRVRPE
jgi:hypothetical protein